jgi:hypothetical protein
MGPGYERPGDVMSAIRGDMRRLEADSRDERHLNEYAAAAGITAAQAKAVLDKLFDHEFYPDFTQLC